MRIDTFIQGIKEFQENISSYIQEYLVLREVDIVDLNVHNQLFDQGVNADGVKLWDIAPYKVQTILHKKEIGLPSNRVTLYETGDFYKSVIVRFFDDAFELIANNWKVEELQRKYGENILGLTQESMEILIETGLSEFLVTKLREKLDLAA